jgi:L-seryl-tRNA(Ser) seleniumtransferase
MPKEVREAWEYASQSYVPLIELHDRVGERIASMTGAEAAMVTSGAAGALTVGTAACITGTDQKAIRQIPDLTGLKSEVIVQRAHRNGYDHAVRTCGIKMIEIETAEELERSISDRTAMLLFFNYQEPSGKIKADEFVALGRKNRIPTMNDCAADVPPVDNLTKFVKAGFDLVAFSGGKGLRGPQSAGLLLGRRDLIQAARLNTSPYSDSIARGQKVNKEELLAMMVALELYMKKDHQAEWKQWERWAKVIADSVAGVPTVTAETYVPQIANQVPHLRIRWDTSQVKVTPPEVMKLLREGKPSIEVNPGTNRQELVIGIWMMQPGEAQVVGRRLREVLRSA